MKTAFYVLLALALLLTPTGASAQLLLRQPATPQALRASLLRPAGTAARATSVLRPAQIMDYSNDPSTGRWVSPTRHTLTYNARPW